MTASDETLLGEDSRDGKTRATELTAGARVGRYTVLERIGKGGMGIVYAAYDPELNRRVAIKVLQQERGSTLHGQGRRRLLREAQAMARLSHPNVITVHDVGEADGLVFIAMEFVEGHTLTTWLAQRRPIAEVLAVFRQAGEGLAAAHRVGLVHRDFKPDNVMIDAHARVRVLDFGLARAAEIDAHPPASESSEGSAPTRVSDDAFSSELTREGTVMGTPRYMAPEQHLGTRADEATDQFSFCVALYEALFHQRPFEGDNAATLAIAVTSGRARDVPTSSPVPARIRGAVLRGLALSPRDRFPSMRALLDALSAADARRGRAWTLPAVGLGVIACAAAFTWATTRPPEPDRCAAAATAIAEVWGPTPRAAIESAFRRSPLPVTETVLARTFTTLDGFAAQWTEGRRLACERRELDTDALAVRRQICFEQARRAFATTIRELGRADEALVLHAAGGLDVLPRLNECDDEASLAAAIKPAPPEHESAVEAARARLTEAQTLRDLGRYDAAALEVEAVLEQLTHLDYAPLAAEARAIAGDIASYRGDFEHAREALESAYFQAGALGHDRIAFKAAIDLTWNLGVDLQRPTEAHAWARHAAMVAERLGNDVLSRERIAVNRGSVFWREGKLAEAEAEYRKAIALADERDDARPQEIARNFVNLGLVLGERGEAEQSLEHLQRALALQERELGHEHPELLAALNNLGSALSHLGRYDEAIATLERALTLARQVFGDVHPSVARARHTLAIVTALSGRDEAALAEFERVHALRTTLWGADSPQLASSHINLAVALGLVGRYEEERTHLDRARVLLELGDTNAPSLALLEYELGQVERELERLPESLAAAQKAVAQFEAIHGEGTDHPQIAQALASLAETELRLDHRGDARQHFERALAIGKLSPDLLAPIQFGVARTLPTRERARARELIQTATLALESRTDRKTVELVEAMQRFLATLD